jgi:chaperonin GroEL
LLSELGSARKVITNMSKTQIIDGKGNQAELAGRVADIKSALMSASGAESAALRTRLASLLGGITIIKVGGVTVTEMEEKKDRVVDAMSASKAALESGIVAGGGMALLRASVAILGMRMTAEERVGAMVVYAACREILKQIAINTGVPGDSILSQAMATPDLGFNAVSGEFENLIETGIIDPVSVVCESLNNAAAVACSILTMGATVVEESDAVQK